MTTQLLRDGLLWWVCLPFLVGGREIYFPPVDPYPNSLDNAQQHLQQQGQPQDELAGFGSEADFYGLLTYANVPYAKCLNSSNEESYDIAILGAPFDTVCSLI